MTDEIQSILDKIIDRHVETVRRRMDQEMFPDVIVRDYIRERAIKKLKAWGENPRYPTLDGLNKVDKELEQEI